MSDMRKNREGVGHSEGSTLEKYRVPGSVNESSPAKEVLDTGIHGSVASGRATQSVRLSQQPRYRLEFSTEDATLH